MQSALDFLIEQHRDLEGPLLPLLHAVQHRFGYVPGEAVPQIARGLNLSVAEVHGVVSFYHDFKTTPRGRHVVQICCAEACQARGARTLEAYARERLDIDYGDTSAAGNLTLERVYCLGNCACGPSVRIGDDVFANVDSSRLDELLAVHCGEERAS
jgi:formate dehydrogenase subunit gamma